MKKLILRTLTAFLLTGLASAMADPAGSETPTLIALVHRSNMTQDLTVTELRRFLLGEVPAWPDKTPVIVVLVQPDTPVLRRAFERLLGISLIEYQKQYLVAGYRGNHGPKIRMVTSGQAARQAVASNRGAIAVLAFDPIWRTTGAHPTKLLRINGKEPGEPGYVW